MATASYGKSFGIFLFYGLVIAVMAWLGYHFTKLLVNVSSEIGAFLGTLVGIGVVVLLYIYIGKKYMEGEVTY